MILPQEVEVELNSFAIKYYEDKGYEISRKLDKYKRLKVIKGTKIFVNVKDLPNNSSVFIKVKCDYCNEIINKRYIEYFKNKTTLVNKD